MALRIALLLVLIASGNAATGETLVVAAGPAFKSVATNSMGEMLMATPALPAAGDRRRARARRL